MASSKETPSGAKRVSSKRASLTRLWGIRLGVVLAAGLIAGATAGVVGVNTLEPGRPSEPDSLQVLLDSIAKGTATARPERGGSARAGSGSGAGNGGADTAASSDEVTVPDLIGTEEGNARSTLTALGLNIGTIEFRASASPAGMVLASSPLFNEKVKRGTSVALVLSSGRAPGDTLSQSTSREPSR
jgi:hypothetical protein